MLSNQQFESKEIQQSEQIEKLKQQLNDQRINYEKQIQQLKQQLANQQIESNFRIKGKTNIRNESTNRENETTIGQSTKL